LAKSASGHPGKPLEAPNNLYRIRKLASRPKAYNGSNSCQPNFVPQGELTLKRADLLPD
jgi:hypothetical protein